MTVELISAIKEFMGFFQTADMFVLPTVHSTVVECTADCIQASVYLEDSQSLSESEFQIGRAHV
jgi:hypothetical protein